MIFGPRCICKPSLCCWAAAKSPAVQAWLALWAVGASIFGSILWRRGKHQAVLSTCGFPQKEWWVGSTSHPAVQYELPACNHTYMHTDRRPRSIVWLWVAGGTVLCEQKDLANVAQVLLLLGMVGPSLDVLPPVLVGPACKQVTGCRCRWLALSRVPYALQVHLQCMEPSSQWMYSVSSVSFHTPKVQG